MKTCKKCNKKIINFKKGHKVPEEWKKNMGSKSKEVWQRPEYKEKQKQSHIGHIPTNAFKKGHTPAHKGKKLVKITGELHWNWQGGKSEFGAQIKRLLEYKTWRKKIFERDNYTCQICGQKGDYIDAHHINAFKSIIKYNKIKTIEDAIKCKELWNINWGATLCKKCHNIFRSHIIWISGNSGSGKTTLGKQLQRLIKYSILLDGDAMRRSISIELGFSEKDRNEHNLRVARLAKVLAKQGHLVIVTLICPYRKLRAEVKKITNCKFIYLKGGKSGPEYPYEPPINPEILLENGKIEWPDKN